MSGTWAKARPETLIQSRAQAGIQVELPRAANLQKKPGKCVKIFAHRGDSSSAPENTLAAFERAAGCGADGVEFDVQLSRDGIPVVIHDEELPRTARVAGRVAEWTLAELKALDVGSWFSPEFAGERIPTLSEVLELLRPTGLAINIEFKTGRVPYEGLVAAAAALAARMGLEERVIFSSFNHFSLLEAKALAPAAETAALVYEHLLEPWEYAARHGFGAVHPAHEAATETLVNGCHAAGLAVRCWTVNRRGEAERLMALGVDGIVTNFPGEALMWCGRRRAGEPSNRK